MKWFQYETINCHPLMMYPDSATRSSCNQFNTLSTYWLIPSHTCIFVSIKKKKNNPSLLLIWIFMWATSFAPLRKPAFQNGFQQRWLYPFPSNLFGLTRDQSFSQLRDAETDCSEPSKKKRKESIKNLSQEGWWWRICSDALQFHTKRPEMNAPIIF